MPYTTAHIDLFMRGERIDRENGQWYPFEVYLWRYEEVQDWNRAVGDLAQRRARADQRNVTITARVVLNNVEVTGYGDVALLAECRWVDAETYDRLRDMLREGDLGGSDG